MQDQEFDEREGFETSDPESEMVEEAESPINEVEEMELAAELLGVNSEEELDNFLGKLLRAVSQAGGAQLRISVRQALGGLIKGAIHKSLPVVSGVIDGGVPGGVGNEIGSGLAREAGPMFGLELEGLSPEDREFEAAKQMVRLTGAAVQNAVAADSGQAPLAAAREALGKAAQTLAPGLLREPSPESDHAGDDEPRHSPCGCHRAVSGRWVRRGRTIVLHGL